MSFLEYLPDSTGITSAVPPMHDKYSWACLPDTEQFHWAQPNTNQPNKSTFQSIASYVFPNTQSIIYPVFQSSKITSTDSEQLLEHTQSIYQISILNLQLLSVS